jgi:hypothetical protein
MKLTACPHEKEVRELIASGQWPAACPLELRAHAAACRACGELVLISVAFREARAESLVAARPVPPALLIWRAQLRRRNAAVERIGRPLLGAQIFALAMILAAAVGFAGFEAHRGVTWLTWSFWRDGLFSAASQWNHLSSGSLAGLGWLLPITVLATLAMLGGAVVFLATEKQ